eukprot:CAMPEP_0169426760 /NCGR_PEP_ID=MMETSP1042-20121227/391_1 /TAXON_ID=464988 /ORGANISM="Hemiselmis andersenii, Strain CCMP1180" /LENGTH=324 /DNA_ID=CAMNT_0009536737 /DNA_START=288 /DNA_END=1259 /DNA_ORIENTATION=+
MRGGDDSVYEGGSYNIVVCGIRRRDARLHRHAVKLWEAVAEAYSPGRVRAKLPPVVVLRLAKATAVFVNAGFGRMFLGWAKGESRLLDFVGLGTHRLFGQIYGRELCREESMAHLRKRLYYCVVTAFFTVVQIIFSYAQLHIFSLAISVMLLPILLDRQWSTLVSRMQSRYDRSQVSQLSRHLGKALAPLATTTGMPTRFGLRGMDMLLGGLEMCVGGAQFVSGALIFAYSVSRAARPTAEVEPELVAAMTGLRVAKELANLLSPLIEQRRQPAQFDRNEDCVRQILHGLTAVASSPMELALRIHEQPEAEAEFMHSCEVLTAS